MADSSRFPTSIEMFSKDERVYQTRESNKWRIEDANGLEWEFVPSMHTPGTGIWRQASDEEEDARNAVKFQEQYQRPEVDEATIAERQEKKRRAEEIQREEAAKKQRKNEEDRAANKAVYVTGLPLDTDDMEIYNVFSRAGLIDESWDTDKPRITMYFDDNGEFKGEALIVYWKPEYVARSIYMFNGSDFRKGADVDGDLKVEVADSAYKAHDTTANNLKPVGGQAKSIEKSNKPAGQKAKPKYRHLTERDKQKIKDKQVQMESKLSWDFEEADTINDRSYNNKWERMLVFQGMFTPQKLVEDPALYQDIKDDLKMMCTKFGEVTSVVIYNAEPKGIATVRFTDVEDAVDCQKQVDKKVYDGSEIRVWHSTGLENFKKDVEVKEEVKLTKGQI